VAARRVASLRGGPSIFKRGINEATTMTPSDDDLLKSLPISQRLRLHELDSTSKKMLVAMLRIEHERGAVTMFIADDGRGYRLTRNMGAVQ
jgi:hypothetical protein